MLIVLKNRTTAFCERDGNANSDLNKDTGTRHLALGTRYRFDRLFSNHAHLTVSVWFTIIAEEVLILQRFLNPVSELPCIWSMRENKNKEPGDSLRNDMLDNAFVRQPWEPRLDDTMHATPLITIHISLTISPDRLRLFVGEQFQ